MRSRKVLTEALCARYRTSERRVKGTILGEFCQATGYNRGYGIYSACTENGYNSLPVLISPSTSVCLIPDAAL